MEVFLIGVFAVIAAAISSGVADSQSYVQLIKQRNSHLSHPPAAHNPPVPELYTAGTQAHFTQLYGGPLQDTYTQLYERPRPSTVSHGSGAYGQPDPEEDEYQPSYGKPAQVHRPVAPAYPQHQQRPSTTHRPISYPQPTQRTTSRPGSGSYQNAIEDEDLIPERGYGRPVQQERPATRRPVNYPQPQTTERIPVTTRPPVGGYPQPAIDDNVQPINPAYPQPQRRSSTTRRPFTYPQPTIQTFTTSRRPTGVYPGTALEEVGTPTYGGSSRNKIPPPPPAYPQPAQKQPSAGSYGNDIDGIDQETYRGPQQNGASGGYVVDNEQVENGGYGRQTTLSPSVIQPSVQKQKTFDEVAQGEYGGPSRPVHEIPAEQTSYPSENKPRPISVLPPRKTTLDYPSASELPNPAAASQPQNDFISGRLDAVNPDYFPQISLARSSWPATPAVAPIPAFSADSLNYQLTGQQPVEYVLVNSAQQW